MSLGSLISTTHIERQIHSTSIALISLREVKVLHKGLLLTPSYLSGAASPTRSHLGVAVLPRNDDGLGWSRI